ncbi:flagellar hook-length control protein FliK [Parasalinivibrio latis]|uniref:flagellar hook-length control protein FliK n=1 Tax=Parasalinivibrio latis TaxID=2952610 RepID=UPI0030E47C24
MQISTPMPQKAAATVAKDVQVNRNTKGDDTQFSLNSEVEQTGKTGTDSGKNIAADQAKPSGKAKNEKTKDADQNSDSEEVAEAVENAFPQLPPQAKEQIAQWVNELREGKISAHDLADKVAKQLQSAGVSLPDPAVTAMESLFKQVASGETPVSALKDMLGDLSKSVRINVLESFTRRHGETMAAGHTEVPHLTEHRSAPGTENRFFQQLVSTAQAAGSQVAANPATVTADSALFEHLISGQAASMPLDVRPSSAVAATSTAASQTAARQPEVQQFTASVNPSEPEWGRDLVEQLRSRIRISNTEQTQQAHIRLDPPELGKLEVSLRVDGDKVMVHIAAAHPQLREALSAHADRLRFDIAGSQLQLTDVSVSSGMQQRSSQQQQGQPGEGVAANHRQLSSQPETTFNPNRFGRFESVV